jgi:hypothetical protein
MARGYLYHRQRRRLGQERAFPEEFGCVSVDDHFRLAAAPETASEAIAPAEDQGLFSFVSLHLTNAVLRCAAHLPHGWLQLRGLVPGPLCGGLAPAPAVLSRQNLSQS